MPDELNEERQSLSIKEIEYLGKLADWLEERTKAKRVKLGKAYFVALPKESVLEIVMRLRRLGVRVFEP